MATSRETLERLFAEKMGNLANKKGTDVAKSDKQEKVQSEQDKIRELILNNLAALGKLTTGEDDLVFEGTRFVLPENLKGDIPGAIRYLEDWQEAQSAKFQFTRTFNYRPMDGANAFNEAMKKMWGSAGVGKAIQTFFGPIKPQMITVDTSPTTKVQVPWNRVNFSPLEADFYLDDTWSENFGTVFELSVEAPRKYRAHIDAFFTLIEEELRTNSIYRGKAITGAQVPEFIDLSSVDPEMVIYSEDVLVQLETNMWSLLRYTDTIRTQTNMPLKRAVLMEGPYGTGKTLAGMLTAKEAVENGWTFLLARPQKDNLQEVLKTAQLYAPAVVWFEDIDQVADGGSYKSVSGLLDALDGVTTKHKEILAGFTTNFIDRIHKGVLRPGRLDAVIHVGGLDRQGFEKLVRVTLPKGVLESDVDFDAVAEAFEGFVPAFATEAINRSVRYSMTRNNGKIGKISTADLVNAANGLRPQLEQMEKAQEGTVLPTIDAAFTQKLTELVVEDGGRGLAMPIKVPAAKNGRR